MDVNARARETIQASTEQLSSEGLDAAIRVSSQHRSKPTLPDLENPFDAPQVSGRRSQDSATLRTPPQGNARATAKVPSGLDDTVQRDPLLGLRLGEYVVRERIGVGGMGLVYRGEQPVIGKPVAIKILRPDVVDKPIHMERLLAEARAVNAIRHRGIIDIFSFGQTPDGRQYFVMEFLEGTALDTYIAERGVLTPQEMLGFSEEILAALAAAHEAGVIHRDLKPNNIFLVKPPGGGKYVKVLDFGLAKLSNSAEVGSPQTQAGLIVGTPEYMAPEQIRAEPVSAKTDLYAFGILAFQMLTGQLPFTANSPAEYLVRHLERTPPAPIELMPDIPPELSELVVSLLAKDPKDRPAMAQVRAVLRQISQNLVRGSNEAYPTQHARPTPRSVEPPSAKTPPLPEPAPVASPGSPQQTGFQAAIPKLNRLLLGVSGVLLALLIAGGYFVLRRLPRESPAPVYAPAPTPGKAPPLEKKAEAPEEPSPPSATVPTTAQPPATAVVPSPKPDAVPPPQAVPEDPPPVSNPGPSVDAVPSGKESKPSTSKPSGLERRDKRLLVRVRKLEDRMRHDLREGVKPALAADLLRKLRLNVENNAFSDKQLSAQLDNWEQFFLRDVNNPERTP